MQPPRLVLREPRCYSPEKGLHGLRDRDRRHVELFEQGGHVRRHGRRRFSGTAAAAAAAVTRLAADSTLHWFWFNDAQKDLQVPPVVGEDKGARRVGCLDDDRYKALPLPARTCGGGAQ